MPGLPRRGQKKKSPPVQGLPSNGMEVCAVANNSLADRMAPTRSLVGTFHCWECQTSAAPAVPPSRAGQSRLLAGRCQHPDAAQCQRSDTIGRAALAVPIVAAGSEKLAVALRLFSPSFRFDILATNKITGRDGMSDKWLFLCDKENLWRWERVGAAGLKTVSDRRFPSDADCIKDAKAKGWRPKPVDIGLRLVWLGNSAYFLKG